MRKNGSKAGREDLPISIGLTIGLSVACSELASKLTVVPQSVERGLGMFLAMVVCYWAPWNRHAPGGFQAWIVTSFCTGLIVSCIALFFHST
jgi:hypothetical protein